MRLTFKDKTNEIEPKDIYFINDKTDDFSRKNQQLANQKLGQLEDWEEKIEMPLIKFLEWRIGNKIPYCIIEGKIKKVAHYSWLMEQNIIEVWDANLKKRYRFHFRDYGKSWALTKEELTK